MTTDSSKSNYNLPIILFDSECSLCVRFKQSLDRIGASDKYNMVSLHDDHVYELYPFLDKDKCQEAIHLVDENKQVFVGSDTLEHIIKNYPGVSKFSWLIESEMGKKTLDMFYSLSNKYRDSLLNKCPKCKNRHSHN